jgi:ribose 5-phosphate isomerase B
MVKLSSIPFMKIAIGADHAGFALKEQLRADLAAEGHQVMDFGTDSAESVDYPDYAQKVGREVSAGRVDRGVLVCGTGIGMEIAANKIEGVRAASAQSEEETRLSRAHNDANIVTFGARLIGHDQARRLLDIFLSTSFEGGRHARRIAKIAALEHHS